MTMPELEPILKERARLATACAIAMQGDDVARSKLAQDALLKQLRESGWQAQCVEPSSIFLHGINGVDVYSREVKGEPIWLSVNCHDGTIKEM